MEIERVEKGNLRGGSVGVKHWGWVILNANEGFILSLTSSRDAYKLTRTSTILKKEKKKREKVEKGRKKWEK